MRQRSQFYASSLAVFPRAADRVPFSPHQDHGLCDQRVAARLIHDREHFDPEHLGHPDGLPDERSYIRLLLAPQGLYRFLRRPSEPVS